MDWDGRRFGCAVVAPVSAAVTGMLDDIVGCGAEDGSQQAEAEQKTKQNVNDKTKTPRTTVQSAAGTR